MRKMVYSFSRWGCSIVSCKKFIWFTENSGGLAANTEDMYKVFK